MVAHDVLGEGTEVSRNLRELSVSLHHNAERLLRDVRLAHGGMTARLDQVASAPDREPPKRTGSGQQRELREDRRGDDLDVPEFIPRE